MKVNQVGPAGAKDSSASPTGHNTATATDQVGQPGGLTSRQMAVLKMQHTLGNQAVQRMLAAQNRVQRDDPPVSTPPDLTEGNKFNVRLAKNPKNQGEGQLWIRQAQYALRDYGSGGLIIPNPSETWDPILLPLTAAIAKWQAENMPDTPATGKLDDATRAKMKPILKPTAQEWTARDAKEAQAVQNDEQTAVKQRDDAIQGGTSADDATRDAVVSLARSQTGTVFAGGGRNDGKKYGWERIKRYYVVSEEAYLRAKKMDVEPADTKLSGIKGGTTFANQTPDQVADKKTTGDWSWCGLFAAWVVKTVTGKGDWMIEANGGHMTGLPTLDKNNDLKNVKRGDVIVLNNAVHHHFIVATDHDPDGPDTYEGIEGNAEGQEIRSITLTLDVGKIDTIYSLANAYTPPAPATTSAPESSAPQPAE